MITKYISIAAALLGMFIGSAGTLAITKAVKPKIEIPACPACNCPPVVSLQNFDVTKLNNKKGNFTYSPQLNNVTIKIENKDSALVQQLLNKAILR